MAGNANNSESVSGDVYVDFRLVVPPSWENGFLVEPKRWVDAAIDGNNGYGVNTHGQTRFKMRALLLLFKQVQMH